MFTVIAVSVATLAFAGGLLTFWNQIADFVQRTLLPLCDDIHPSLKMIVRTIFRQIDRVATPVARMIRDGWRRLQTWLVGQLVYYERVSKNRYIQKVVTYFRRTLDSGKKKLFEQTERREIDPLDIPAEFRERVIGLEKSEVNITDHIDQAIRQMDA